MSSSRFSPRTHIVLAAVAGLALALPFALGQPADVGSKPKPDAKPAQVPAAQPGKDVQVQPTAPTPPKPLVPELKAVPGANQPPVAPQPGGIAPSDAATSPLEFDAMAFDFGNIPDTDPITHIFKFKNKTENTVVIRGAHGSCGCTVPDLAKKNFAPGESGEMSVTFSPKGRRGANPKAVTIEYAEPAGTPVTIVTINSNVQPLVIVDPLKGYVMDVDTKTGQTMDLTVAGRKADFKVTSVDCKSDAVKVTIGETTETVIDGDKFQQVMLKVQVLPKTPVGSVSTELSIHTNEEKSLVIPYFFNAEVVGDLKAAPGRLAVRAFTPNVAFSNIATLESRSGKAFKIRSIDVTGRDDMNMVVDVEPNVTPEKTTYTLKLNGVTPDITGVINGEIVVKTDLPDEEEIKIPYTASVRGSQAPKFISPNAN